MNKKCVSAHTRTGAKRGPRGPSPQLWRLGFPTSNDPYHQHTT